MTYALPLLTSFILVLLLVPSIRDWALQYDFVDMPAGRKIHLSPIPLLGGAAIYVGCIVPMFVYRGFTGLTLAVFTGGTVLFLIGLTDDWFKTKNWDFPVWPRLVLYIIVSSIPIWFDIRIEGITNFTGSGMMMFPDWLSWMTTMGWIFCLINMINFIDGLDGLASGIVTISAAALLTAAYWKHQDESGTLAAILVGTCAAFLIYNFHPAKIFMGDAGAIFLGYTIAVVSVDGAFKGATVVSILFPVLVLGVPILDTTIVFSRRLIQGKGIHIADKLHLHHSLMKWGLTQTQAVSFLYLIALSFSLLSLIFILLSK